MSAIKREAFTLLLALLFSSPLPAATPIGVSAQQEMTPEWTIENPNHFTKLAVSVDGEYIAASTNKTDTLNLFHKSKLLWASPVDPVSSLAMSDNGEHIAVGTNRRFYLFTRGSPTPQIAFQLDEDNAMVAISASGNTTVVGTTYAYADENNARLYLFEKQTSAPVWNATLLGTLVSLSMSDDGDYFVASTSRPGILYVFASEQATPLWTYPLGERSGGAKVSNDGGYIVAVGGNQTGDKDIRIHQFHRMLAIPHYTKVISALPSPSGVSITANGSIFAISYANSLMFFNLDLPPYGYGPGSVLKATLPSRRVSMAMSSDGRHIVVGTGGGVFAYEYANHQLNLRKQYTINDPFITDVASSANGQFIIAAAIDCENHDHSAIHFFDSFTESHPTLENPWVQLVILVIIVAVVSAATVYVLRRSQTRRETAIRSAQTVSRAGNYLLEASRL